MVKKHLKTLTVPNTWSVKKKGQKFVTRPLPGKSAELGMPISLVFKNLLKYCKTTKEVKTTLQDKEILVDGKRVKNPRSSLGFMDVLSIPVAKENYRLILNAHKKLQLVNVPDKEHNLKICKITGKTVLKKGKVQLNLFDGRNIIVKEGKYKIGDSVLITLPKQEIKQQLSFEKGSFVYLIKGKHTGEFGLVEKEEGNKIIIKSADQSFETQRDYVFVVGKDKPLIKLE